MQQIPAFYFDPADLGRLAAARGEEFRDADPFQHIVFDDFLPREIIDLLIAEFPKPTDIEWELHGPGRAKLSDDKDADKLASSDETKMAAFTRHLMSQLNSGVFLAFLEELTGMKGIIADVSYNNCGMHSTGRGGRLMVHTDVNRHPLGAKMHQCLNLLLYLNDDWSEDYGGHLELWNDHREPVKSILPISNRVVIFNTGTRSWHGHPHPLTCPPDRRRNSLALYYYLRDRPADDEYAGMQRSVHWVAATDEDKAFAKETRERGLERIEPLRGFAARIGAGWFPFAPDSILSEEGADWAPLYLLRREDFADRSAFAATHLAAAIKARGLSEDAFFESYQPIGLLGADSADRVMDSTLVTCLLDEGGEMHVVMGPEAEDLYWVGYLDEIIDSLGGA